MILAGTLGLIVALVILAWLVVPNTQYSLRRLLGLQETASSESTEQDSSDKARKEEKPKVELPSDWAAVLSANGAESRLGDALRSVMDRELGNPLAGVIVLTDGRNNAGVDPKAVVPIAQNAKVPLYMIGLGSERRPPNLQLVEVDAPRRLYPGDRFQYLP